MKKLKTLFAAVVATVALCALLPMAAFAAGDQLPSNVDDWGTVGSNISWEMHAGGTLELTGVGEMGSWKGHAGEVYDVFPYASQVKKVVVGEGITRIAGFAGFGMTDVSLPETLVSAAEGTFYGCASLKSLVIPDGFDYPRADSIVNAGCESLESLSIPCAKRSYQLFFLTKDMRVNLGDGKYKYLAFRHDLKEVGFQPVVIADDGTSKDGHYEGLQCASCKLFFADESCTVDCTKEKTIPRLGVVGFDQEFREGTSQTVGVAYYTGQAIEPSMFVHKDKGLDLNPDFYEITMPENMVDIGTYYITIKLKGDYQGEIKREFHIVGSMDDITVEYLDDVEMVSYTPGVEYPSVVYCGKNPTRDMFIKCVKYNPTGEIIPEDQWELQVSGSMPNPAGYSHTTSIKAAAGSNYRGTNNKGGIVIKKLNIWDPNYVSWPEFNHPFLYDPEVDGDNFPKPEIEGTVLTFEGTLQAGSDFNVKYEVNDEGTVGTAWMSVKDSYYYVVGTPGVYEHHIEYPLAKVMAVDACDISVADCMYSGKACEPKVKITVPGNPNAIYEEGVDYTVEYKNNVDPGTATAVITAVEGSSALLKGSTEITFNISPVKLSACTIAYDNLVYTGSKQTPKVTITNPDGVVMATSTYTVGKTSSASVGKRSVKITGKGGLTSTKTIYVKINPKVTSINKLYSYTKAFKVTWSKKSSSYCTGYQIKYSTKEDMSSASTYTVSKRTTTYKKFTSKKAKTTYYVQMRTYKKVSGVKYYSDWSSIKSVTTK